MALVAVPAAPGLFISGGRASLWMPGSLSGHGALLLVGIVVRPQLCRIKASRLGDRLFYPAGAATALRNEGYRRRPHLKRSGDVGQRRAPGAKQPLDMLMLLIEIHLVALVR